ncbi:uncharacterized protein LOC129592980 isoform X2 [Paramacrobiotus metropolitanus]|nr:uncharacterized protein LOC129592980 isoform X2 [Paramacrobiotus metropolitanus]
MKAHWSNISRRGSLQDDILFSDAGVGEGSKRFAGKKKFPLWPKGMVPYRISELFGSQDAFVIQQAMSTIHSKVRCVTFPARKQEKNYISFELAKNCSSYVGVKGGIQPIFLDPVQCMRPGIVQHEILHALGLFHEHSRSDRNTSVKIFVDEIMDSHKSQYDIIPDMDTFGTDYDLESLMHYGPYDFAKTIYRPVIIPRMEHVYRMGQREALSVRDVAKLRNAYHCQADQRFEIDEHDYEERSFPGFSGLEMQAEQCAWQFNQYCSVPELNSENCTTTRWLNIWFNASADTTLLRSMAMAMAKAPLRPIGILLKDQQITGELLSPIEKQVLILWMLDCQAHDATVKLSSFNLINLQHFEVRRCIDMRIRMSDFRFLSALKIIVFEKSTILYLEKGAFTNLPQLQMLVWHRSISSKFGVVIGDKLQKNLARSMPGYLKRMHCDCEFAWLRKWLPERGLLRATFEPSAIFYFANGKFIDQPEITINDVYIPIDCAVQPFPSDFDAINFNQSEFSVNAPQCPNSTFNATYESLKVKRTFTFSPIDISQCQMQFGKSCRPWERHSSLPATETTILIYCQQVHKSSKTALAIGCWSNATVRDVQDIAFALAKPPLRMVKLNVSDGSYLCYRAFAPVKTQILVMQLYDCLQRRTTGKLPSLAFENLLYLEVNNCHNITVRTEDFADFPNIRVILFAQSTVDGVTQFTFSSLPNLEALSMEIGAREALTGDSNYYQYLRRLHCDCQYNHFRSWLQQRIIDRIPTTAVDSNDKGNNASRSWTALAQLDYDVEGETYRYQWWTKEMYQSLDCATGQASNDFWLTVNNNHRFIYSVNAPSCPHAYAPTHAPTTRGSRPYLTGNKTLERSSTGNKEDWTASLSKPILQERRSELTAQAIDEAGRIYHYDDQALSSDPAAESGLLSSSRFWLNNGKDIAYLFSEALDIADREEIKEALHSISIYTAQCVTFKARELENDYIFFRLGQRCQSSVGRQGGQQNITLTQACIFRGALQHLVLHAFGLFHEHHRADRSEYLSIYLNRTELPPNSVLIRQLPQMATYGTEYDLESIMHYGAFDLADPEHPDLPVFLPKTTQPGKRFKMGQRRTLSAKDIVKLYTAYNCTIQVGDGGVREPIPNFVISNLPPSECDKLATLKCASERIHDCSLRGFIPLSCDSTTTLDDWHQTGVTVANLTMRVVELKMLDSDEMNGAPAAFMPIRNQILFTSFSMCQNSRFSSRLAVFRFINLMQLHLRFCYGLIVRKKDFCGFPRLLILLFVHSTILHLDAGTFSALRELTVLSLESDLLNPTSSQSNVSRSQLMDYLRRLHCSCDFAHFRRWRESNKVLRLELGSGEITYVVGIARSRRIKRDQIFYPVDCLADPHASNTTELKINSDQREYSINEPVCDLDTIKATITPSYSSLCGNTEVNNSSIPEPAGNRSLDKTQNVDAGKFHKLFNESKQEAPLHSDFVEPYRKDSAVHEDAKSYSWIYGCVGGVFGLCIILAVYVTCRCVCRSLQRAKNAVSLENGPLLGRQVATVSRPSVQISTASTELTHTFGGEVDEMPSLDLTTEGSGTELLPLNSATLDAHIEQSV